jgi:prepilin-type N-terminal cleavage/methylation domain-containing protein
VLGFLYRRLNRASASDEGFTLIEVIVALTLLLFIMSSSVVFFIRSLQTSALQGQRSTATALGTQQLELARNVAPLDLLCGRTQTNVSAQWTAAMTPTAPTTPSPALNAELATTATSQDWSGRNPGAPCALTTLPASGEVLPTALQTVTIGKTTYSYRIIVGDCWVVGTTCSAGSGASYTGANATKYVYRIIVAVQWTATSGLSCSTGRTCYYIDETLRDWHSDPTYVKGT